MFLVLLDLILHGLVDVPVSPALFYREADLGWTWVRGKKRLTHSKEETVDKVQYIRRNKLITKLNKSKNRLLYNSITKGDRYSQSSKDRQE